MGGGAGQRKGEGPWQLRDIVLPTWSQATRPGRHGSGLTSTVSGLMSMVSGTLGFMAHLTQAGQGEDGRVPSLHQLCEAMLSAQDLGGPQRNPKRGMRKPQVPTTVLRSTPQLWRERLSQPHSAQAVGRGGAAADRGQCKGQRDSVGDGRDDHLPRGQVDIMRPTLRSTGAKRPKKGEGG